MKNQLTKTLANLFLLTLLAGSLCQPLQAQDLVQEQLYQNQLVFASRGYSLTHDIKYGYLYEDNADYYYVSLTGGRNYQIYAVCDGDCGDIDLCLYDENNNKIRCDEDDDDEPVVSVTPAWSGSFKIKVIMYDCGANPCKFGIAVNGR